MISYAANEFLLITSLWFPNQADNFKTAQPLPLESERTAE